MAPNRSAAVPDGRIPHLVPFMFMATLMAALLTGRSLTRTDPADIGRTHEDPQKRGAWYEDHLLQGGRLQREVAREGSAVRHHPRIFVPLVEIPARYYAMPTGHRGGVIRDKTPHESSALTWPSVGKGGFRIPDAIATRPDDTQVIYELKCPSPWLQFDPGSAWAEGMQTAFASQALAYFTWAKEDPARRKIFYGFCGLPPLWSEAILRDLSRSHGIVPSIKGGFLSADFPPAERLMGKPMQETLTAMTLDFMNDLAPGQLTDARFDLRKD